MVKPWEMDWNNTAKNIEENAAKPWEKDWANAKQAALAQDNVNPKDYNGLSLEGEPGEDVKPFEKMQLFMDKLFTFEVRSGKEVEEKNKQNPRIQALEKTIKEPLSSVNWKEVGKSGIRGALEIGKGVTANPFKIYGDWMRDERDQSLMSAREKLDVKYNNMRADSYVKAGEMISKLWDWGLQAEWLQPDEKVFAGSFVENPSMTRALSAAASGVASIGWFGGVAKITGSRGIASALLASADADDIYFEAREKGASQNKALGLYAAGTAGTAVLEKYGFEQIFNQRVTAPLAKRVVNAMTSEGLTEGMQTTWQNLIKKIGYDKTQQLFENVVESIIGGALSGGAVSAADAGYIKLTETRNQLKEEGFTDEGLDALQEAIAQELGSHKDTINAMFQEKIDKSLNKFDEFIKANEGTEQARKAIQTRAELEEVYNQINDGLIKSGMNSEQANANAKIWQGIALWGAEETGKTPLQFLEENAPRFQKENFAAWKNGGNVLGDDYIPYQFGGQNARTADINGLDQAKDMENVGYDSELIRGQTGWFKGVDGKWRFEISDKDATVDRQVLENIGSIENLRAERKQLLSDIEAFKKERENNNDAYPEGYLDDLISQRYDKIEKIDYDIDHGYVSSAKTTLGELLDHEKLYAAYPSLRYMPVTIRISDDLSSAAYSRSDNTIYLDSRLSDDEIKSVLMHEIQHVIQDKENFSRGGNMDLAKSYRKIIKTKEAKDFHKALERKITEAMTEQLQSDNLTSETAKEVAEAYGKYLNAIFDDSLEGEEVTKIEQGYYQLLEKLGISPETVESAYKAIQDRDLWQQAVNETKSKLSDADAYDIYRAFAGEVEARNTQARMNLSEEERQATPPEETQDIKNTDALVVMPDGTEVAYVPEVVINNFDKSAPDNAFVKNRNGNIAHGVITKEISRIAGIPAGEIRVYNSLYNHLSKIKTGEKISRLEQIKNLGYDNPIDFIDDVMENLLNIQEGKDGSYMLTGNVGNNNTVVIKLERKNGFYKVATLMPRRKISNKKTIWEAAIPLRSKSEQPAIIGPNGSISISPKAKNVNRYNYQAGKEISDEEFEADLAELDKIFNSFAEDNKAYYDKKGKYDAAKKIQKKYQNFFMYNIADAANPYGRHDPFYFEYDGKKDITNIWVPKKLEKGSNIILYSGAEQTFIPVEEFEESKFKKLGFKRQKMYDEGLRDIYTLNQEEKSERSSDFVKENGEYRRVNYQPAFAGSRVDYDQPSLEAIGTGEGAQAHGWGLYYALNKDVAEDYRRSFISEAPGDVSIQEYKRLVLIKERGKEFFINKLKELIDIKEQLNKAYTESDEIYRKIREVEAEEDRAYEAFLFEEETDARKEQKEKNRQKLKELRKEENDADNKIAEIEKEYNEKITEEKDITDFIYTIPNRYAIDELENAIKEVENADVSKIPQGQVHEVDLPESPYLLDEDKTISGQSKYVKDILKSIPENLAKDKSQLASETYESLLAQRKKGNASNKMYGLFGEDYYKVLSETLGSAQAASQYLEKLGIKGITYDGRQDGRCFVIFNPKDVKVIQKFYQGEVADTPGQMPRGAYTGNIIYLFENADASTFMHETAHWFDEELSKLNTPNALEMRKKVDEWENTEFDKRYKIVEQNGTFAVADKTGNVIYGADQPFMDEASAKEFAKKEIFARGFEQFLRDGRAPNNYLKEAFRSFLNWLRRLYKAATELNVELNDDIKAVYGQILGGENLDFFLEAPVDEILQHRFEMNKERQQANEDIIDKALVDMEAQTYNDVWKYERHDLKKAKESISRIHKENKAIVRKAGGDLLDKLITPIDTRLNRINPKLKNRLVNYEARLGIKLNNYYRQIKPFMEIWKTFSRADAVSFDLALKNGYMQKQLEIVNKYNAYNEFVAVKNVLANIFDNAISAGIDLGYLPDYFPRQVKDANAFLGYLEGDAAFSPLRRQLDAWVEEQRENNIEPTPEEKIEFINRYMMGFRRNEGIRPLPGNTKDRMIDIIDKDMNKFYKPSTDALISYIEGMNAAIEQRRLFGRDAKNIANTIGAWIDELMVNGEITPEQDEEVRQIFAARFSQRGVSNKYVAAARDASYIYTMGGINSAITQFDDIFMNIYENGVFASGKELFADNIKGLSRQDLGLESIGQEYSEKSLTSELVNKTFKLTGLDKIDSLMKTKYTNLTFKKFVKMANEDPDALRARIEPIMEELTPQVMEDLKAGRITEDVQVLMFNALSEFQPISLSQMPEGYLKYGNLRVLYMLKTFTLKRIDTFRRKCYDEYRKGNKKEALQNLFRLSLIMMLCGMTKDALIDMLYGRPFEISDMVANNILGLVGLSKYQLYKLRDDGVDGFLFTLTVPPLKPLYTDLIRDLPKVWNGKKEVKDLEIFKGIPLIGRFYYWWLGGGRAKIEKKQNKGKRKLK